jgi:hypothetical protein
MTYSVTEDEYAQLLQLKRICEFWSNSPNTDADSPSVLTLIKTTLATDTEAQEETESETEDEEETQTQVEQERRVRKQSIYAKIAFDERYDLIGKTARNHMASRTAHFKDNPYGIPIGVYVRCPRCDKVAVSNMKVETRENTTDVLQRFRHENYQCWERVERIYESLEWDKVFARKLKYNKKHGIDLDSLKYPETEQVTEVEETIDEDANEIETEATVN